MCCPYNISESEAANTTVLNPNKTKIIGAKQHRLANKTGIPVILNKSFQFTILSLILKKEKTFKKCMEHNPMKDKIIQQGAEAKIIKSNDFVIKDRIPKGYRIPELDEKIRKRRTRSETKLLEKASKIINSPKPIEFQETYKIKMPFIEGKKLSDDLDNFSLEKQKEVCKKIGENIAKLHDSQIIHGDLTTSNMILKNKELFFIDFGLGFISYKIEDMAVDLYLLKEALEAKHFKNWEILLKEVMDAYKNSEKSELVLKQFKKVERRGRYKDKY